MELNHQSSCYDNWWIIRVCMIVNRSCGRMLRTLFWYVHVVLQGVVGRTLHRGSLVTSTWCRYPTHQSRRLRGSSQPSSRGSWRWTISSQRYRSWERTTPSWTPHWRSTTRFKGRCYRHRIRAITFSIWGTYLRCSRVCCRLRTSYMSRLSKWCVCGHMRFVGCSWIGWSTYRTNLGSRSSS